VELEKSAGVVVGVVLEVEVSGVLEGERLVVVTPKLGVLTLEGSVTALVMAVLELGLLVEVLETGGVTGDAGGVVLEDGGDAHYPRKRFHLKSNIIVS
jgi:hypothetical protein